MKTDRLPLRVGISSISNPWRMSRPCSTASRWPASSKDQRMELHAEAGRYSTAFVASVVWHIAALLLLAMGARTLQPRYDAPAAARLEPPSGIVWLSGDD